MFSSRGFATFHKLQVDLVNELDNHHEVIADVDPDPEAFPDPKTDEGGTVEYAYWKYAMGYYSTLLDGSMPSIGTYLIDLDSDQIIFFDKDTYEWLWRAHDGVHEKYGRGCISMMTDPAAAIQDICTIEKWSLAQLI